MRRYTEGHVTTQVSRLCGGVVRSLSQPFNKSVQLSYDCVQLANIGALGGIAGVRAGTAAAGLDLGMEVLVDAVNGQVLDRVHDRLGSIAVSR